ncbi:putative bifunctional diguanylate cyclase/phosphodiesterase [Rheinheimera sp. WS51]|uniref:putative bifunctional diguanylate cyclase/phosphodiesterase n=1 Tax=Rheinheimera sp. WS51 TaxID=3425886 RepID=UPI003D8DCE93
MTAELFARLAIYSTQLGVALLLSYLLWHFSRIYRQSYIQSWFFAFIAFSVYQLGILIRRDGMANLILDTGFNIIVVAASYGFAVFLLRGMTQTRSSLISISRQLTTNRLVIGSLLVGILTVVPFVIFDDLANWRRYFQSDLRLFLMGVLLLVAALSLWHQLEKSLGQRLSVVTMLIWGGLYISFSVWMMFSPELGIFAEYFFAFKCFELLLICSMGLALLIWLQEHERNNNMQLTKKTLYLDKHDQLTGALNRDALLLQLDSQIQLQEGKPVHLLMLGLDKFKTVNESVGIKQGDKILRLLVERFSSSIIKPVLIARTGGDIFALVIKDINNDKQLQFTLDHITQLVEKNFVLDTGILQLSCSVGFSSYPEHASTADALLQKANIAFHQAKRIQNSWLAYQPGMEDETTRLICWENDIFYAMEQSQFVLYFQPQLCLKQNKLDGFEVLVRWQHPSKGLLMPGQFLPYVEQLGLSRKLDVWILQQAIKTIQRWQQQSIFIPLAVNMSPLHFQQEGLKAKIQQFLLQYQVPPQMLELEITENTAMQDMEVGSNHVMELQQMGIRLSIDDFGTGYSSLSYLRQMPIDKIKIDRSFIAEMADNDSDMMIVKTMIKLAHGLGKRILAEGVETKNQLELLRSLDCDSIQGYFYAKPLSEQDALAFYAKCSNTG